MLKKDPRGCKGITTGTVCESPRLGVRFEGWHISSISSYIRIDLIPSLGCGVASEDFRILFGSIVHHLFPIRDSGNLKFRNLTLPKRPPIPYSSGDIDDIFTSSRTSSLWSFLHPAGAVSRNLCRRNNVRMV